MQLTGFGTERNDDLADAFAILMLRLMEDRYQSIGFMVIGPGWVRKYPDD